MHVFAQNKKTFYDCFSFFPLQQQQQQQQPKQQQQHQQQQHQQRRRRRQLTTTTNNHNNNNFCSSDLIPKTYVVNFANLCKIIRCNFYNVGYIQFSRQLKLEAILKMDNFQLFYLPRSPDTFFAHIDQIQLLFVLD